MRIAAGYEYVLANSNQNATFGLPTVVLIEILGAARAT